MTVQLRRPAGAPPRPGARPLLVVGALGIVFGDIGTSPLYAFQFVFSDRHGSVEASPQHVLGVLSLVFWSILVLVSLKYVAVVLSADHRGEGGILALATLVTRAVPRRRRLRALAAAAGMAGAALFLGDGVITPAISVLSAVEGVTVAYPDFPHVVVPLALGVLVGLFSVQRFGTGRVARAFGPVMLLWFVALAALGLPHVLRDPEVLAALSPHHALRFAAGEPLVAFAAMGAVVLAVAGAEALYADIGHLGTGPIRRAWLWIVLPSLTINYFGQGALILRSPEAVANPFFRLGPAWSVIPLVCLATAATVIASQAVISGAFSVSRQAMRLGYLPVMEVRSTSARSSGQIYMPLVNAALFAAVVLVVLAFQSARGLSAAYGVGVTTTFVITSLLILGYARIAWRWPLPLLLPFGGLVLSLESAYLAANLAKVPAGGWLPLALAALVLLVMSSWRQGRTEVTERRALMEGTLPDFLDALQRMRLRRVPGTAVFPHASASSAPLALRVNARVNRVLHERVLIVRIRTEEVPRVPDGQRVSVQSYRECPSGIVHLTIRFGFLERADVPAALREARERLGDERLDVDHAIYLLTRLRIRSESPAPARRRLFLALARLSGTGSRRFHLPAERTVELSSTLTL
ncbi:MAG: KUP/HAK/KT family potassium transporter [Pseudoclavibacter sp.]|nr:KUP/HAK/KT family potassium transporter [Pseudoclavibacter sp.]